MSRAVIVGASVAGVRTAQALRREGFTGDVMLIGDEPDLPYDKPPLSKAVLAGTRSIDEVRLLSREHAAEHEITLRLGTPATELDITNHEVKLADGAAVYYDHLVLATGTRARPSPWGMPPGLHLLRSAADCAALGADLAGAGSVVVIGAGFIGSEVAATAVHRGLRVTMVDPVPQPLARIVGPEVADVLASVHVPHGVDTRFGVGVHGVSERDGGLAVALTDGSEVRADVAVVGIGAVPNVEWLADSGLALDDGIVCDEYCRAVGTADVYAAGDAARWWHASHGLHRRVEHWTHAGEQAAVVAHNICHPDDLHGYDPVDYVWSDQYDWRIQMVGRTGPGCVSELTDEVSTPPFAALYRDEAGAFTGAVTVNWQKAMIGLRRLLSAESARIDEAYAVVQAAQRKPAVAAG